LSTTLLGRIEERLDRLESSITASQQPQLHTSQRQQASPHTTPITTNNNVHNGHGQTNGYNPSKHTSSIMTTTPMMMDNNGNNNNNNGNNSGPGSGGLIRKLQFEIARQKALLYQHVCGAEDVISNLLRENQQLKEALRRYQQQPNLASPRSHSFVRHQRPPPPPTHLCGFRY
jgi:hypothetical protein